MSFLKQVSIVAGQMADFEEMVQKVVNTVYVSTTEQQKVIDVMRNERNPGQLNMLVKDLEKYDEKLAGLINFTSGIRTDLAELSGRVKGAMETSKCFNRKKKANG
jgi:uncharacterized tellurite resistance protein B-like protein